MLAAKQRWESSYFSWATITHIHLLKMWATFTHSHELLGHKNMSHIHSRSVHVQFMIKVNVLLGQNIWLECMQN